MTDIPFPGKEARSRVHEIGQLLCPGDREHQMDMVRHGTERQYFHIPLVGIGAINGKEHQDVFHGIKEKAPADGSLKDVMDPSRVNFSLFHVFAFWGKIRTLPFPKKNPLKRCVVSQDFFYVSKDLNMF